MKIIFLIHALFFLSVVNGQLGTDYKHHFFWDDDNYTKGRIKTLSYSYTSFDNKEQYYSVSTEKYDSFNNAIELITYHENKSGTISNYIKKTKSHKYNDSKKLIEIEEFNNNKKNNHSLFLYNPEGLLKEKIILSGNKGTITYSYNEKGLLLKEVWVSYDTSEFISDTSYLSGIDGTDPVISTSKRNRYDVRDYIYDNNNKLQEINRVYNIQKRTNYKFIYDVNNNLVEVTVDKPAKRKEVYTNKYDNNNKIILQSLSVYLNNPKQNYTETDYYDNNGNRIRYNKTNADGSVTEFTYEYKLDSLGRVTERKKFKNQIIKNTETYKLDEIGNRIEERRYDADGNLLNLVERKITYYQ